MYNMYMNMMMLNIAIMVLVLVLSSTPLNMGLWIIFTVLFISATISMFTSSFLSFIFFLIYIGSLLVMFSYFIAIQPNQKLMTMKMMFTSIMTLIIFMPTTILYILPATSEKKPNHLLMELILPHNIQILTILAMILFLTLVAVVKMTKMYLGPLRPFH